MKELQISTIQSRHNTPYIKLNSASLRKQCSSIQKTNEVILHIKAIAVYCKNHKEHTNTVCE
jgi:hypothetical protein